MSFLDTGTIPIVNQSNLMVLANNLRTGNIILDMFIMTILTSVIGFVLNVCTKENFLRMWSSVRDLLVSFFHKERVTDSQETDIYKVIINYEYLKCNANGNTRQSNNNFIIDNNLIFEALFSYFSKKSESMFTGEFAIKLALTYDYEWERVRSNDFKIKPLSQIKIDDFIIDFQENVIKPDKKEKHKDTPNKAMEVLIGDNDPDNRISYQNRITISSHTKKIPEILAYIRIIYTEYVDSHFPKPKTQTVIAPPKYYLVKSGDSYKRYNLTSKTTFNHIFFPDKEKLLRQINRFTTGKIPLSKFTILLHGPPGGGKTSFIKALHNLTGNHVIVVKLSQYYSLKELINTFHEERVLLHNGAVMDIPIEKRIYLFEDIDAEDEIVLKRDDKSESPLSAVKGSRTQSQGKVGTSQSGLISLMGPPLPKTGLVPNKLLIDSEQEDEEGTAESSYESEEHEDDRVTYKKGSAKKSNTRETHSKYRSKSKCKTRSSKSKQGSYYDDDGWGATYFDSDYKTTPSIKLADILNLLDGVLELCGCFVVLTTNFKNKLDTALVRPGRITYDLELTHIKRTQMIEMLQKFIPDYESQLIALSPDCIGNKITDQNTLDKFKNVNWLFVEPVSDCPNKKIFNWLLLQIEERNDCMPCRFESLCHNEEQIVDVISHLLQYIETPIKDPESQYS